MIENTKLTALVASRICHDMVEPMSAIIQGLEMIKDGDGKNGSGTGRPYPLPFGQRQEKPPIHEVGERILLGQGPVFL